MLKGEYYILYNDIVWELEGVQRFINFVSLGVDCTDSSYFMLKHFRYGSMEVHYENWGELREANKEEIKEYKKEHDRYYLMRFKNV